MKSLRELDYMIGLNEQRKRRLITDSMNYVISDIHGCYEEYLELLSKIIIYLLPDSNSA